MNEQSDVTGAVRRVSRATSAAVLAACFAFSGCELRLGGGSDGASGGTTFEFLGCSGDEDQGPVDPGPPAEWATIEAGTFMMGSPPDEPDRDRFELLHPVTLTRSFSMQKTEVTQGQWYALMGFNPSEHKRCGPSCPVESVNWFDAVAYVNELSKREGLPQCYRLDGCTKGEGEHRGCTAVEFEGLDCRGYRLPTEAEWEYAARAGTKGRYYGELEEIAWFNKNAGLRPHPVGEKRPNAFGLYDMLGNVAEWCHDWMADYPEGAETDPTGRADWDSRSTRGGSYVWNAGSARAARRSMAGPEVFQGALGFRPAKTLF